ncbi:MAG: long-chain fatty acid--CoA ligase [Myxococcales bacterium]|nr:long-chain fatty acid--CoA ligase [Myxococcales bacterium]
MDWLLEIFNKHSSADAVVWHDRTATYGELLNRISVARDALHFNSIAPGEVVLLDADFSPAAIAMLLALMLHRAVVVPIAAHVVNLDREAHARIAGASRRILLTADDDYTFERYPHTATHPLYTRLQAHPGLVLFSSGSTGEPRAALHDLTALLQKFRTPRHTQRILTFLLFDHIGGFNSLLYALANHGCVITVPARDPTTVCRAIARHRVEVLPTSPTFLNMLLISGEHTRHDLSSLRVIGYATEVMPPTLLKRLHAALPGVELRQNYGLSELGILRSQSRDDGSTWVRVGGEGYETRVVAGTLRIRATSSMLGYLNAPDPFDADGWFDTQDEVEVDGEWLRFLGRRSEVINVGGEKVYPADVEAVILELEEIADVTVSKEPHPFTGNIVVAEVRPHTPGDPAALIKRVRTHCFARLPTFKVPVKIRVTDAARVTDRFKKSRRD